MQDNRILSLVVSEGCRARATGDHSPPALIFRPPKSFNLFSEQFDILHLKLAYSAQSCLFLTFPPQNVVATS